MMPARHVTAARLAFAAAAIALSLAACGKKGDVTDLRPPPPAEQPAQGTGG
ncbi:MAG: hypothetical protein AB7I59_08300 [Geminicoccaceae bacterium]